MTSPRTRATAPSPRRKPKARPSAKVTAAKPKPRADERRIIAASLREWAGVYAHVVAELGLYGKNAEHFIRAARDRADVLENA